MIEIKNLKPEYTFLEISKIARISKDKVKGDFRKQVFSATKKTTKHTISMNYGSGRFTRKRPTWMVSQKELLRYLKYLMIKSIEKNIDK